MVFASGTEERDGGESDGAGGAAVERVAGLRFLVAFCCSILFVVLQLFARPVVVAKRPAPRFEHLETSLNFVENAISFSPSAKRANQPTDMESSTEGVWWVAYGAYLHRKRVPVAQ